MISQWTLDTVHWCRFSPMSRPHNAMQGFVSHVKTSENWSVKKNNICRFSNVKAAHCKDLYQMSKHLDWSSWTNLTKHTLSVKKIFFCSDHIILIVSPYIMITQWSESTGGFSFFQSQGRTLQKGLYQMSKHLETGPVRSTWQTYIALWRWNFFVSSFFDTKFNLP